MWCASERGHMVCQQVRDRAAHCSRALIVALALVVLLDGTAEGANRGRGKGKAKVPQDTAAIGGGGAAAGPAGQTGQGLRPEDMWEWHDQSCGAALVEKFTGNYDQAVQMLGSLISQVPNVTATWLELGAIFGGVDDGALARRCLRTATRLDRHETKAAAALRDLRLHGRLPPLVPSLDLGGDGADPAAEHQSRYKRRLYERYYHLDCRMRRLQQTLNLNPRDVAALLGSAEVSSELLYHNEAVDMLERALVVEPSNGPVFVKLVEAQVKGCVFSNWDANFKRLESFVLAQAAARKPVVLGPVQSTMYPLGPKVGLAICRQGGEHAEAAVRSNPPKSPLPHPTHLSPAGSGGLLGSLWSSVGGDGSVGGAGRLTVGYVTSHFTSSSIGREMLFLLGSHLASAIETRCFGLNADDGSWLQHTWRSHIALACHKFEDVSALDDEAAAGAINRHQVHVLIDLNGWSGGNRVQVISRRPAPIQVNYKNWVASAGIPALVYNIGDLVVSPPEFQDDYTESMVLVANSYFISGHRYQYLLDHRVQHASQVQASAEERGKAREEHGLPRDHFIVANFNNLDKLEPRLWTEWVGLLARHPRAALWLQKYPPAKAARVYQMAKEHSDVDMTRLVMTPFFKSDHHIGIKALADVFVDNPTYNAHSTAMDTLWGALPLVSLPEEKMAARVGASLLAALHSSWGVVRTLADMSAVVERLMKRPRQLRRLRLAMENARHSAPLFDTVRGVRNLETSLRLMWEAHVADTSGRGGRHRPHIIAGDVGPISATQSYLASPRAQQGRAERDALEAKLFAMRVETTDAESIS